MTACLGMVRSHSLTATEPRSVHQGAMSASHSETVVAAARTLLEAWLSVPCMAMATLCAIPSATGCQCSSMQAGMPSSEASWSGLHPSLLTRSNDRQGRSSSVHSQHVRCRTTALV